MVRCAKLPLKCCMCHVTLPISVIVSFTILLYCVNVFLFLVFCMIMCRLTGGICLQQLTCKNVDQNAVSPRVQRVSCFTVHFTAYSTSCSFKMYVSIRVLGAMLKTGLFYCSVGFIFLITGCPLAKFATLIIFSLLVTILIHNDMMQNEMR